MGGDLPARAGGQKPTFMVYALRDPIGGNLDRIQIVKGWLEADGTTHERVYDVAWSGDRRPGPSGKLPPVGNTVDAKTANFTNTIGAPELGSVWTDPSFDAKLPTLFRIYLRHGAMVCGPPAIDRRFKTIDYLVLFDVEAMDPRMFETYFE